MRRTSPRHMFGDLDQAQIRQLAFLLHRGYLRTRRANGGMFAAHDDHLAGLAGELFGLWEDVNSLVIAGQP
jgi:hypothetical protein